jgi:hypothetical protein
MIEGGLSPSETSDKVNEVPLSALWNRGDTIAPGDTFDRMPPRLPPAGFAPESSLPT